MDIGTFFFALSKSATSGWLDASEVALFVFGIFVVVGVVGESAKSPKWKSRARIFDLCVIIGVSGELVADGGVFVFSTQLQTISDTELAGAIKRAGDAKNSADNAADAAKRANESSRQANQQAQEAQASAGRAKGLATEAEARAEALTPRNLTLDEQKSLILLAENLKGVPATFVWPKGDPEVQHIEGHIAMCLSMYWDIQYVNFSFASYVFPGIRVETFSSASQKQRNAAKSLATELSKHLSNVSLAINPDITPPGNTVKDAQGAFVITVGPLFWGSP